MTMEKYEILTAQLDLSEYINQDDSIVEMQNQLAEVGEKLDLYTSKLDLFDFTLAVASGVITGYIDSKYITPINFEKFSKTDLETSLYNVLNKALDGEKKKHNKSSISKLANEPDYTGLLYSIARQLQRTGTFKEENGELHFHKAAKDGKSGELLAMAGLAGIMDWIIQMADEEVKSKSKKAEKPKKDDAKAKEEKDTQ